MGCAGMSSLCSALFPDLFFPLAPCLVSHCTAVTRFSTVWAGGGLCGLLEGSAKLAFGEKVKLGRLELLQCLQGLTLHADTCHRADGCGRRWLPVGARRPMLRVSRQAGAFRSNMARASPAQTARQKCVPCGQTLCTIFFEQPGLALLWPWTGRDRVLPICLRHLSLTRLSSTLLLSHRPLLHLLLTTPCSSLLRCKPSCYSL